jgi:hypothetical protein
MQIMIDGHPHRTGEAFSRISSVRLLRFFLLVGNALMPM